MNKFTLEEIYVFKTCHTANKDKSIRVLKTYLNTVDYAMKEIIQSLINKLYEATEQEFLELINYPVEMS